MLQNRCIKEKHAIQAPRNTIILTVRNIKFAASDQQFQQGNHEKQNKIK